MKLFKLQISIFFIIFLGQSAYACMCGNTSVREAYFYADIVLTAEVVKIEDPPLVETEDGSGLYYKDYQQVTLKSLKNFKGNKAKTLVISQENSTCDWWFDDEDEEQKFLLYLYKREDGTYSIISCGRSTKLNKAFDDLSWLNGLPDSLKRNRISGTVKLNDGKNLFPPIAGIRITVSSPQMQFNINTDKNGFYEVWDLPKGKYTVFAETPVDYVLSWTRNMTANWTFYWKHFEPDEKALEIELEKNTTGGINFMFESKKDEK